MVAADLKTTLENKKGSDNALNQNELNQALQSIDLQSIVTQLNESLKSVSGLSGAITGALKTLYNKSRSTLTPDDKELLALGAWNKNKNISITAETYDQVVKNFYVKEIFATVPENMQKLRGFLDATPTKALADDLVDNPANEMFFNYLVINLDPASIPPTSGATATDSGKFYTLLTHKYGTPLTITQGTEPNTQNLPTGTPYLTAGSDKVIVAGGATKLEALRAGEVMNKCFTSGSKELKVPDATNPQPDLVAKFNTGSVEEAVQYGSYETFNALLDKGAIDMSKMLGADILANIHKSDKLLSHQKDGYFTAITDYIVINISNQSLLTTYLSRMSGHPEYFGHTAKSQLDNYNKLAVLVDNKTIQDPQTVSSILLLETQLGESLSMGSGSFVDQMKNTFDQVFEKFAPLLKGLLSFFGGVRGLDWLKDIVGPEKFDKMIDDMHIRLSDEEQESLGKLYDKWTDFANGSPNKIDIKTNGLYEKYFPVKGYPKLYTQGTPPTTPPTIPPAPTADTIGENLYALLDTQLISPGLVKDLATKGGFDATQYLVTETKDGASTVKVRQDISTDQKKKLYTALMNDEDTWKTIAQMNKDMGGMPQKQLDTEGGEDLAWRDSRTIQSGQDVALYIGIYAYKTKRDIPLRDVLTETKTLPGQEKRKETIEEAFDGKVQSVLKKLNYSQYKESSSTPTLGKFIYNPRDNTLIYKTKKGKDKVLATLSYDKLGTLDTLLTTTNITTWIQQAESTA